MPDLDYLIPQRRYGIKGWLNILKNLFPKGFVWRFPVIPDFNIWIQYGIESEEAFGELRVFSDQFVEPSGIGSGEAFGDLDTFTGIHPSGILTAEGLGSPVVLTDGTYITDGFSGGVYDSYWDSAFTSNWSLTQYTPSSGNYVAVRGSQGVDRLTGDFSGSFELTTTLKLGPDNTGNNSVSMQVKQASDDALVCELEYWGGTPNELRWSWGGVVKDSESIDFSQYLEIPIKLIRQFFQGPIRAFWFEGPSWTELTPQAPAPTEDSLYISMDGADKHGVDDFDFKASSGFPNP